MNPGYVLAAIPRWPAKAPAHQPQQHVKYSAAIRTHCHGRAELGLPRLRGDRFIQGSLPREGHLDAETPRFGRIDLTFLGRFTRFANFQDPNAF